MRFARGNVAQRQPRTREGPGAAPNPATDGQLLRAFVERTASAEAAFTELVRRHGAMVLGACRSSLRDAHDADDAFQAVFLVLATRAGAIRRPELLGPWLHGVAARVAKKARGRNARRRRREGQDREVAMGRVEAAGPSGVVELGLIRREEAEALHQELDRLPEAYRVPLVLCDLGGLTHVEAAERLHWPSGSVSVRLMRARRLLRERLTRRGLAPASAAVAALALEHTASAAVPRRLAASAVRLAHAGPNAAGVSASVWALARPVVRSMAWFEAVSGALVLISAVVAVGLIGLGWPSPRSDRAPSRIVGASPTDPARSSPPPATRSAEPVATSPRAVPAPSAPAATASSSAPESVAAVGEARAAYLERSKATGRDADAQVALALWCEARGLPLERQRHLSLAVLNDPTNVRARGLIGQVSYAGGWRRPDAVAAAVSADTRLTSALAAYNLRRDRAANTAEAQWRLALWCDQNDLKPEATAHLMTVTRLDPDHEAAWKRLGCKKVNGRWLSEEQAEAERVELHRQKEANRIWRPLLARWRGGLSDKDPARRADAEQALAGVSDPYAVPLVWSTFARGGEFDQRRAVQLLGQIDAPSADLALGVLALSSVRPNVRKAACETLARRDARAALDFLVGLLRDPELNPRTPLVRYHLLLAGALGIGSPGVVFVEGRRRAVLGLYTVDEGFGRGALFETIAADDYPIRIATQRRRQVNSLDITLRVFLAEALSDVAPMLASLREGNAQVIATLKNIVEVHPGDGWEDWKRWWVERQGYAYDPGRFKNPPDLSINQDKPIQVESYHFSCFAAGTPVRTLTGPRPIDSIRTGDRVLTQDVRTGALSFAPVLAAVRNHPAPTSRIEIDGCPTPIVATEIHRFWAPGRGWVPARDLKPGDPIRTLAGPARIASISADGVQPVFNLEVGPTRSFFAGGPDALVHDNSGVEPPSQRFDASPEAR